jgi:hyperosmotically inducible protein
MKNNKSLHAVVCTLAVAFAAPVFADAAADNTIITELKDKISKDPSLAPLNVTVDAKDGVVTLVGEVSADSEASTLILISQNTPGVSDVDTSLLKVKDSKQPIEDTAITAKVKGIFIREKLFNPDVTAAMTISVETNNGVVYLTGTADTQVQAENAVKLAKAVKGVKNVESHIQLKAATQ